MGIFREALSENGNISSLRLNQLIATIAIVPLLFAIAYHVIYVTRLYGIDFPDKTTLILMLKALKDGTDVTKLYSLFTPKQQVGIEWAGISLLIAAIAAYLYQIWYGKAMNKKLEFDGKLLKSESDTSNKTENI